MFSYFENRKTTYFDIFCLNFCIETKIKTFFSNFIFQFIKKKRNGTLGTRIQVDAITSSYGLSQLVCEPTHILPNLSSCIDLIFINQNKFTRNSGVHASLHPNFHHPIVYAKLNLKTEYPPPII